MSDLPGLVLLHGFTNTGASWSPVVQRLGERYRPIALDIRGHGSATDLVPVTLDAVIDDIAAVEAPRFTLVGYSQGGRIALHAALRLAPRVERLVLIGASPGIADPTGREERRLADERLATELEGMTIDQFAQRWAQTPVLSGVTPEVAAAGHRDRLQNTATGLARALRGLGTGALPSVWGRLGELRMPVTVVAGERDQKFTKLAGEMAALIRGAEVVIVPGAGHAVHLERPDVIAALL